MTTFGIIIVTAPGDWLFAKGTIASSKYYMPEVPVALIVDGEIDTRRAEETYGITVVRKDNIDDSYLRENSFGWGITKMLSFWYSPFDTYVYADSDVIIWGSFENYFDFDSFDYIVSIPNPINEPADIKAVRKWFFEPEYVEKRYPDFPWRKYAAQFVCSGVFAARRAVFSLEEYKDILKQSIDNPTVYKYGDMGFHNLMVFRDHHLRKLRLGFSDYQVIFPEYPMEELKQRFPFENGKPKVQQDDAKLLHMPDHKPLMDNLLCYSEPMTFFRLKFIKDTEGLAGENSLSRLKEEDAEYHRLRAEYLKREKHKKIRGLLRGNPGEWRRLWAKIRAL
jgi:hypothetical protein